MKSSRYFNQMARSGAARTLALVAVMLLTLEPFAFALTQIVSKYPTGNVITSVSMGDSMTYEKGTIFGFNSAKSAADSNAYATIQEAACSTPATLHDFSEGKEGFATTTSGTVTFSTVGTDGHLTANGAAQTSYVRATQTRTFQWNKKFLWDCGTPSATGFVMSYSLPTWINPSVGLNWFQAQIIKPDTTAVNLNVGGAATKALPDVNGAVAWSQLTGTVPAGTFNQIGVYTLRINGQFDGASSASTDLKLRFDDVNLTVTSGYASYSQDVEFTVRATPYSSLGSNQYLLDIRARKITGDTEATDIQVWNGATWTTRYSVTNAAWTVFNTYYLTAAEYNNGNVRIRYVDATPAGDNSRGGIDVEYQRVTVDQGVCVDQVQDMEADCGKCHNYGGDVTKPWPNMGMHNKHAQSESISDCLWCHPNNGTDSGHRNGGTVTIAGTKVYRVADGNLNGAPANANYDGTTKQCSNVACHKGLTTPAWDSVYGVNIERNCSRCHNNGAAAADNAANLNINVAWPNTGDGGGHTSHNAAVAFDEYSCQSNGSCHPDNRGQHSVVGDGQVVVKMAPNYGSPNAVIKYIKDVTNGTGTCVNVSCHGGQVTPRFNLASTNPINLTLTNGTACIMCHVGEQATGWGIDPGNATQYNSPISGLHRGSPPVSGQDHAAGLTNGCQACHALAGLTKHFQFGGVTNLDTPAMDPVDATYFVAALGYTAGSGTSPNYTTPPSCGVTTTTCHAESNTTYRNPATTWKRKWSWDAYDTVTPVNQCKNCHGHWGSFSTGVVQPHVFSNTDNTLRTTLMNNHTDNGVNCATMCHGQGGTNYNHGVAIGATSKDMSLNTNAGVVKTPGPPARVGCNFCHSANDGAGTPDAAGGNHVFAESNWVTDTLVTGGVAPTCYNPGASTGCHGDGVSQYWPDDTPSAYPNRGGKHSFHITKLATKLGYALPGTDQQQKTMCAFCHPFTLNPGESGHSTNSGDSTADLTAAGFNPIWSTITSNYPSTPDGGTAAAFTIADGSCAGIDCHNNQSTTATYNWRTGAVSTCVMCHTVGGTNSATTAHPASGVHDGARISGRLHDDNFAYGVSGGSTATCVTCHTATPTTTSGHMNGTNDYSIAAADATDPKVFLDAAVGFTDAVTPTCAPTQANGCHIEQWNATTDHTWTRPWHENAGANNGTECKGCHGTFTQVWNTGVNPNHNADFDTNNGAEIRANHRNGANPETEYNQCISCHVYNDTLYETTIGWNPTVANKHGDGLLQMTTARGYTIATNTCTSNCHGVEVGSHAMTPDSGWTIQNIAGPALTCASCHASITSHTDADGPGATYPTAGGSFCLDCHTDHAVANRTGTNGVNNVYIKTTYGASIAVPTMNQQYSSATHNGWIQLGGTATSGYAKSTEAEMCWACHDARGVSEWGTNQHATTGNLTYDYGDLYTTISTVPGTKTSDWTTGFWRSGRGRSSQTGTNPFWYKRGSIQSTHSVNFDSGTAALTTSGNSLGFGRKENKDTVANIRCAYCHDVHGTHNTVNGDTSGGAGTLDSPYLRGTWKGNAYAEDGAPQLGMGNWSPTTNYGAAPRVSASATNAGITAVPRSGGWWIDQNSNHPNSQTNVHATSGLCEQCHGTNKTGTWATANLGTIDWATSGIEASNSNWVSGYNGHANSVLNGPGRGANASPESYARNIFTRTKRGTTQRVTGATNGKGAVDMGLASEPATNNGYSYRGAWGEGFDWTPNAAAQGGYRGFAWGTALAGVSRASIWATGSQALTFSTAASELANFDAQANYHTFTCSKCHNPHASRLPKLMISNCLDTNHNTWEDNTTFVGDGTVPVPGPTGIWANARHSQWASAQNCHRLDARASLTSGQTVRLGTGWNRVTPWLEFTSPNSTRTTITPNVPVQ